MNIRRFIHPSILIAVFAAPAILTRAAEAIPQADPLTASPPICVSDSVSFVGANSQRREAFALDTNRGGDGAASQAEHLVLLHNERAGSVAPVGGGAYLNSPCFHFDGTLESGLTITSVKNDLFLKIGRLFHRTE